MNVLPSSSPPSRVEGSIDAPTLSTNPTTEAYGDESAMNPAAYITILQELLINF